MTKPLFFIDQHGCAKNQVDAELITGHLKEIGWERTDSAEKAKLLSVNSCGFIESAKLESITAVIQAKKQYQNAKILLAGCLAERYCKDDGSPFLEEADAFLGNGDISKMPLEISCCISSTISFIERLRKFPRISGIAQKEHLLLQPSVIFTYALAGNEKSSGLEPEQTPF